jgi:hypothetical protein
MSVSLKINGSTTVNYLVHSLDLELEYDLAPSWFVSVHYSPISYNKTGKIRSWWRAWRILPSRGKVTLVVNGNQKALRIYRWRPFPQKIQIPLKADQLKLKKTVIPDSLSGELVYPISPRRLSLMPELNTPVLKPILSKPNFYKPELNICLHWGELDQRINRKTL